MTEPRYAKPKPIHLAGLMNDRGGVSAVCFKKPRSINLIRASWTLRESAVTCKKCLAAINQQKASRA